MDDKYELKFEKVYPNGCVVRVMSPVLTEEERAKRMENLKRAAGDICLNREEQTNEYSDDKMLDYTKG